MSLTDYFIVAAIVATVLALQSFARYVAGLITENAKLRAELEKNKHISEREWVQNALDKFYERQDRSKQITEFALLAHLQSAWEQSPHVVERAITKFTIEQKKGN